MFLSIGKVAKLVGRPVTTVRYWDSSGILVPHRISKGGTRYYTLEQIRELTGNMALEVE